jgi:hypothetical protein
MPHQIRPVSHETARDSSNAAERYLHRFTPAALCLLKAAGVPLQEPFEDQKIVPADAIAWITMMSKQAFMNNRKKTVEVVLIAFCLVLWLGTSTKPLYAYADPGTGLMAIQILGATFAGFLFFIRKQVFGLFARIRKKTGKGDGSPDEPSDPAPG